MSLNPALTFIFCFVGPFILPFWVGIKLVNQARRGRKSLHLLAGVFTLKPLLTTPLWLALYTDSGRIPTLFTTIHSILPAVFLTTAIVMIFRPVFSNRAVRRKAWILLVLDWAQWGCILLAMLFVLNGSQVAFVFFGASLLMPTIYAIIAYYTASRVIEYPAAKME